MNKLPVAAGLATLLVLVQAGTKAQASEEPKPQTSVSEANEEAERRFLIRPFFGYSSFDVDLDTPDGNTISYVPNPSLNFGAKLGYKKLKVSGSFAVDRVEPVEEYGKSKNFNFELSYAFTVMSRELVVTGYTHFHENLSTEAPDGRYLVEGMDAATIGFDTAFYFNKKFSYERSVDDFVPRSGSIGSALVRLSLGAFAFGFIEEPGEFAIPPEKRDVVGSLANLNVIRAQYVSLAGGYAYDWNIWSRCFFTGATSLGLTTSRLDIKYTNEAPAEVGVGFGPSIALAAALTYVGDTFHTGLTSNIALESAETHDVVVNGFRFNFLVFAGVRL